jgi:hypothetical protein
LFIVLLIKMTIWAINNISCPWTVQHLFTFLLRKHFKTIFIVDFPIQNSTWLLTTNYAFWLAEVWILSKTYICEEILPWHECSYDPLQSLYFFLLMAESLDGHSCRSLFNINIKLYRKYIQSLFQEIRNIIESRLYMYNQVMIIYKIYIFLSGSKNKDDHHQVCGNCETSKFVLLKGAVSLY